MIPLIHPAACAARLFMLVASITASALTAEPGSGIAPRLPPGFRLAKGSSEEPYTKTGWAREVVHESSGIALVFVPAGSFLMGSPAGELNREPEEVQRAVTLSKGFYLGKFEVTQKQWQQAMGTTLRKQRDLVGPKEPLAGDGAEFPMYYVSWEEASACCRKLGAGFRLPSEAEWEYACRAGTTTKYWYGNDRDTTKMNCIESKIGRPTPVDRHPANPWGLHDMHGNLYQPCIDAYDVEKFPHHLPADDPVRPEGTHRVFRGGAYGDVPRRCQAAFRGRNETMIGPQLARNYFGLRVACDVRPAP
jgi:formylglycine-generating enzyme required for sulfatase activity